MGLSISEGTSLRVSSKGNQKQTTILVPFEKDTPKGCPALHSANHGEAISKRAPPSCDTCEAWPATSQMKDMEPRGGWESRLHTLTNVRWLQIMQTEFGHLPHLVNRYDKCSALS